MNTLTLFGEVGWEIKPAGVMAQLSEMTGDVLVKINSYGGDIYEGISIMHALRSHPGQVTVRVEGVAASAASVIAVGGADVLQLATGSELMIHMPWVETPGDAEELRKTADDLDRTAQSLAEIYAEKAGGTPEQWLEMMRAETWFSAQEAMDAGLADAVVDSRAGKAPVLAGATRKRFAFAGRSEAPTPRIFEEENMTFTHEVAKRLGLSATDVDEATVLAALEETLAEQADTEPSVDGDAKIKLPADTSVFSEDQLKQIISTLKAENKELWKLQKELNDAAADADEDDAGDEPQPEAAEVEPEPAEFAEEPAKDPDEAETVTLDLDTYRELQAAAKAGWDAAEADKQRALEGEVEQWITDGRISAALRPKALKAIKADAAAARATFGANPKGTIPRAEIGYGVDPANAEVEMTKDQKIQAGIARANKLAQARK